MNSRKLIGLAAFIALVVCLALTAWAQGGPGRGRGGRCMAAGTPCCALAQPQTPEQKAFVAEVTKLRDQIGAAQLDLATLQAQSAPQSQITAAANDLNSLQGKLRDLMVQKKALCQQMGGPACGACCGACMNCQNCPNYQNCANGQGCGLCCGAMAGAGPWWTRVQPKTAAEKAFVADVTSLHNQILAAVTAGDQPAANSLRAKLHDLMYNNRALHQQLMASCPVPPMGKGRGMGMGACCGRGVCPYTK